MKKEKVHDNAIKNITETGALKSSVRKYIPKTEL